jgi:hypothetical protein
MNLSRRAAGIWLVLKQCELPDHTVDMKRYYEKIERLRVDDEEYADNIFELEYRGLIRREHLEDGTRLYITRPWRCPSCGYPQIKLKGFEVEEV